MEVSSYHEAPYQGVSQAPPQARLKTQAETLDNCLVPIPEGCIKRPPFTWLGKLASHPGDTNGVFELVTWSGVSAILTVTREAGVTVPRVYDFASLTLQPLTIGASAQTYLNTATSPRAHLRATSVVDYTFIASNRQIVANAATRNTARNPEGMLWVRASAYSRKYSVVVTKSGGSPVTVTLTTPSGAATADAAWVDTDVIAASLISGSYTAIDSAAISGNLNSLTGSGFTVSRIGAVIYLQCATDFTIDVEDGQGGTAFIAIKDRAQRFSDLPAKVPVDGFTVRIVQQSGDDRDDFFVRFRQSAGKGTGTWEECLAPNALLGLDPTTMPMGLFNDGAWKLQALGWKQRTTGDEALVPDPDFIGQSIQDITYWRGRLALLAGEGVTLSAADDPFRTYPRSLSLVLDSDPIARVNPTPGVATFRYAVPFQSRLVCFGDMEEGGVQAEVTADGVLTPGKADIDRMAAYPFLPGIRPQGVNNKVYFLAPRTNYAMVYEMAIDRVTDTAEADDLSAAVPRYVPGEADLVASCPGVFLTAYATGGDNALLIHLYRYSEGQRIQNAWQRWFLPTPWKMAGMFARRTQLYVLASNGTEAHVLMADLSPASIDDGTGATLLTHLDFRAKDTQLASPAWDPVTEMTTFTLPYALSSSIPKVVSRAPGSVGRPEGLALDVASWNISAKTVTVRGDQRGVPLWFGFSYDKVYTPSTIYVLDANDKPRLDGRTQLRRLRVDVAGTGYLRADVVNKGRVTRSTPFEGLRSDDPGSVTDQAPSYTGPLSVPVSGQNIQTTITFVNPSHFPSAIVGFEWRGEFSPRSQRI